jgi:hypothetical protein
MNSVFCAGSNSLGDVMATNVLLLTYVPELDGDGSLGDLAHVEADGWNHVLIEGPAGDHIHKGRLPSMLQPHQGQLHLLLQFKVVAEPTC